MKKAAVVLWGFVFVLTFSVGLALAAEKFAYVDVLRIASEYNKAKEYNKSIEGKATTYEAEIDKKAAEIKQLQEKMNLLSDKEKEAKKTEIETKFKGLQDFKRQKEIDLRKEDFENTKEVVQDIKTAIKQSAEKDGYTLVFDDRALVYQASKDMDITDKVIGSLNKNYTKK